MIRAPKPLSTCEASADDRVGGVPSPDELDRDPADLVDRDGKAEADAAALYPVIGSLPSVSIAASMPMTWPRAFTSGPPELPGLIGASVWMASKNTAGALLPARRLHRPVYGADDSAGHRVGKAQRRADGNHGSPTATRAELPSDRAGRSLTPTALITAMSENGSRPTSCGPGRFTVAEVHLQRSVRGQPVHRHDMVVGNDVAARNDESGPGARCAVHLDHHDAGRIPRGDAGDRVGGTGRWRGWHRPEAIAAVLSLVVDGVHGDETADDTAEGGASERKRADGNRAPPGPRPASLGRGGRREPAQPGRCRTGRTGQLPQTSRIGRGRWSVPADPGCQVGGWRTSSVSGAIRFAGCRASSFAGCRASR